MSREKPVYYDPDHEDPLDKAKKKYANSPKGKAAHRRAVKGPVKRYLQTDKGKKALKKHYEEKVKPQMALAKACKQWLKEHPGKTVEDYLKEVQKNA